MAPPPPPPLVATPRPQRTSTAANVHAPLAATACLAPPAPAPAAPATFGDTHESLVTRGDLNNVDVLKRMVRMMVRPALRYMQTRIIGQCAKRMSLLKAAKILDPRHAAAISSMVAASVDELIEAYRFLKLKRFARLLVKMKAELPAFSAAVAEIPAGEGPVPRSVDSTALRALPHSQLGVARAALQHPERQRRRRPAARQDRLQDGPVRAPLQRPQPELNEVPLPCRDATGPSD